MALRDRDQKRPRRLARLGVIRLGYKLFKCSGQGCDERIRETGEQTIVCSHCGHKNPLKRRGKIVRWSYPVQADHFILRDAPEVAAKYGETRELDIILPFPDVARNFDAFYTVWAGGVLICKGDGEQVLFAAPFEAEEDTKGRMRVHNAPGDTLVSDGQAQKGFAWNGQEFAPGEIVPCSGSAQDLYPHCRACKMSAILKMLMEDPELFRLGYYQLSTGSGRNYDTLLGTLELIHDAAGRVSGIPFTLRLVEEATTYKDDSGTSRKTDKWFLQLEPDPDLMRRLYSRQMKRLLDGEQAPPPLFLEGPGEAIEEGEFVEVEEELPPPYAEEGGPAVEGQGDEEAEEQKKPSNSRPYSAAQVKAKIAAGVKRKPKAQQTGRASVAQRGLLNGKLEEALGPHGDEDTARLERLTVLGYLFPGMTSSSELTLAQASCCLDWLLDPDRDDGTYDLHRSVSAEAYKILYEVRREAGQVEMEL